MCSVSYGLTNENKSFVEGMAVGCKTLQSLRHIVINQQVNHQMVVLDELALHVSNPLVRQRPAAECDPQYKSVKSIALVCQALDQPSQLDIRKHT
jgi:hypothetical protein